MIIGDLDLDRAENDTDYLARIMGFLASECSNSFAVASHDDDTSNFGIRCSSIVQGNQLGIEFLTEKINEIGGDTT